jgi:hypothetical protein
MSTETPQAFVQVMYRNAAGTWSQTMVPLTKFVALNPADLAGIVDNLSAAELLPLTNYSGAVAVTQLTDKTTAVTLNRPSGKITTNNAGLNAATIVSFTVTCSACAAGDVVVLNHVSGGTPGSYTLNARAAAGSFTIDIRNNTAGTLTEAIVITYAITKAATA